MGPLRLISSLLINRRCNGGRSCTHYHHRRAQQATVEQITLLKYVQNFVGIKVSTWLHLHCLMILSIEGLARLRINDLQLIALERVPEHFQGQLDPFAHRTDVFVVRVGQLKATLQAVDNRQQIVGEFFQREFVSFFDILLGTAADVLQIGGSLNTHVLPTSCKRVRIAATCWAPGCTSAATLNTPVCLSP